MTEHRHLWRTVQCSPLKKRGPTGHWGYFWGIWEQRRCCYCDAMDYRWMPRISEPSRLGALDAMRPKDDAELRQRMRRDTRLARIETEHKGLPQCILLDVA